MSFLGYCLLLILYLLASNARQMGAIDKELHTKNYHTFGKGSILDRVERGIRQNALSASSMNASLSEEKEAPQGNDITSSRQMVLQGASKLEERKRQARRILTDQKSHNAEETVDSKVNDDDVEDIVVMDYAQPHRKTPIHNKDP